MNEEIKKEFEEIRRRLDKLEGKSQSTTIFSTPQEKENKKSDYLESEIKVFCKNNGLDENRLKYEIDFQEEYPRIINLPKERIRTNLQFKTLILLAPIYYRIYGKNLSPNIIKNLFGLNRIPLERLDKLYNSPLFKKFFTKSKAGIKLSWAGEQEGIKKLKELIENETNTKK